MKILRNNRGFTIVELLVVIVVIAILVALTLPNLFGLQRRARDDDRKNDLKNIQSSLETYYSDNNVYPDAMADLVPDYMQAVPNDPQGAGYTFAPAPAGCTDNCTSWSLTANLENDNDPQADGSGNYVVSSVNQ